MCLIMLSHYTRHDASRDASDRVASRDEHAPACLSLIHI